jgi:hypothetical protein
VLARALPSAIKHMPPLNIKVVVWPPLRWLCRSRHGHWQVVCRSIDGGATRHVMTRGDVMGVKHRPTHGANFTTTAYSVLATTLKSGNLTPAA